MSWWFNRYGWIGYGWIVWQESNTGKHFSHEAC